MQEIYLTYVSDHKEQHPKGGDFHETANKVCESLQHSKSKSPPKNNSDGNWKKNVQ